MFSTHNEKKSFIAKTFIRILKNKIHKDKISISKNRHIDKLDDIVNKYNNTYHSPIKMKPVDVKSNTYIEFSKHINNKDPKFKIDDIVRISKNKNILQNVALQIRPKMFLCLKVKNTAMDIYD